MKALTGLLYTALLVYLVGWFLGRWTGNFALLLFILTLVTFAYWLAERLVFKPRRERAAEAFMASDAARRAELARKGIERVDGDADVTRQRLLAQPWWLDWTAGLFPVILAVFLLRSFLFEPFKIPSGSMIPTLLVGDLILVNKYHYGIRLPVLNKKILSNHEPQRGDVIVFRYPQDPAIDYIKRVAALPGDKVAYKDKRLYINDQAVPVSALPDYYDDSELRYLKQYSEKLGEVEHRILLDERRGPGVMPIVDYPYRDNCNYTVDGVECTVPAGHYFVVGDNRDNSQDSRFWGFVPDENIVGRAFFIWMNFSAPLERIGRFQ